MVPPSTIGATDEAGTVDKVLMSLAPALKIRSGVAKKCGTPEGKKVVSGRKGIVPCFAL
jgi:hypothetical protein